MLEANGWTVSLLEVGVLPMDAADVAPEGVLAGPVPAPVNVVLLHGHGRTVLVDAGSGPFVSTWPGGTDELRLDAPPDLILISHLDFDHFGGTVTEGHEPVFPGVTVLAPAAAVAQARAAEDGPAAAVTRALDRAGLLEVYEAGDEPAPGLRLRAAPGHRLGHSILEIGDSLVHTVDIVHHPLHVEHLDWDKTWDSEPEVALATRTAILNELADSGATGLTSHIDSPGRIEGEGDGLRWAQLGA